MNDLITSSAARLHSLCVMSTTVHSAVLVKINEVDKKLIALVADKTSGVPVAVTTGTRRSDYEIIRRYWTGTLKENY